MEEDWRPGAPGRLGFGVNGRSVSEGGGMAEAGVGVDVATVAITTRSSERAKVGG